MSKCVSAGLVQSLRGTVGESMSPKGARSATLGCGVQPLRGKDNLRGWRQLAFDDFAAKPASREGPQGRDSMYDHVRPDGTIATNGPDRARRNPPCLPSSTRTSTCGTCPGSR